MDGTVQVVPRREYDSFILRRLAHATASGLGQEEWQACQSCHRLDHKYIGPALGGNPLLGDVAGLTRLLRNGQGQMPPVGRNWTDAQIKALVDYTRQFAKGGGA
jgi:Cytochrome c, mono- and diheme variants